MATINPDPYEDGDKLGPTGCVTAIFDTLDDLTAAMPAISAAGYKGPAAAVFVGSEGKKKLDASGEYHSIEGLRMFQNAVCDEEELFDQFEKTLNAGGAVIAVRTGDDDAKKKAITDIVKSNKGRKVNYWGEWHFDGLG